MSKPVLYTFPNSIWATAAHLALAELEIEANFQVVNLAEGANFNPEFLKINPNATLPTLIHAGKSFTNTTAVINYLVSISSIQVPPETSITTAVHDEKVDPNFAFVASRNDDELAKVSGGSANVSTTTRLAAVKAFAGTPEAQVHKEFYDKKVASISELHALLNGQATEDAKRDFFARSTALWDAIKVFVLETLPAALSHRDDDDNTSNGSTEGPFIGGAGPGLDDFHVGAWLAREGVDALQRSFGPLPENVQLYWVAWIARDSWVKTYPDSVLH
ncbi:hypothetical protein BGY98DRAFT_1001397 [Russula aff. rugulosa BPL654]|nr:hypothetical protein BGY98DRAFT_1001397 [Russula aff. rugulosa BPL654]